MATANALCECNVGITKALHLLIEKVEKERKELSPLRADDLMRYMLRAEIRGIRNALKTLELAGLA